MIQGPLVPAACPCNIIQSPTQENRGTARKIQSTQTGVPMGGDPLRACGRGRVRRHVKTAERLIVDVVGRIRERKQARPIAVVPHQDLVGEVESIDEHARRVGHHQRGPTGRQIRTNGLKSKGPIGCRSRIDIEAIDSSRRDAAGGTASGKVPRSECAAKGSRPLTQPFDPPVIGIELCRRGIGRQTVPLIAVKAKVDGRSDGGNHQSGRCRGPVKQRKRCNETDKQRVLTNTHHCAPCGIGVAKEQSCRSKIMIPSTNSTSCHRIRESMAASHPTVGESLRGSKDWQQSCGCPAWKCGPTLVLDTATLRMSALVSPHSM